MPEYNAAKHIADLKNEFAEHFGELTARQLWAITKLAKRVRLRARNNTAFNNLMNQLFPHAKFRTVQKQGKDFRTGMPKTYEGLEIVVKDEVFVDPDGNESEE